MNSTRRALERQLADLEGARFALTFGSGMAAVAGVTSTLSNGDHIIGGYDIYGGSSRLFASVLTRYGISTTFVDTSDIEAVRRALRPNTKLLWIETPGHTMLRLTDIAQIVALKRPGQVVAVDNTYATPCFQQPIALGADVVVHSTSKYLNGHSDVVGGAVITDDESLHRDVASSQKCMGAIPGQGDSYLMLCAAKTLALRMSAHERNAQAVAEFLRERVDVVQVHYPGLKTHPQHALARRQMSGYGGIVSFRPRGGAARAYEIAKSTKLFGLTVSLGDDLLRLSVGVESLDDLIEDLGSTLDATFGDRAQIPPAVLARP